MRKMLIKEGMLQLGRKLKLGLLIMAITLITLPAKSSFNQLAPVNIDLILPGYEAYKTKPRNLKAEQGSYMTEAVMLVYDEILRYQRNVQFTHGLDEAALTIFDFEIQI